MAYQITNLWNQHYILYPDVTDVERKRVLIIIDSGPGHNKNQFMCARPLHLGVYFYPGVPYTTTVSHKTDQAHQNFKTIFHCILMNVPFDFLECFDPINFPPYLVVLFFQHMILWLVLTDTKMYLMSLFLKRSFTLVGSQLELFHNLCLPEQSESVLQAW